MVTVRDGQRPLIIADEGTYSYQDVSDASMRLARGLIGLGVRAGEPVALLIDNRPELVLVKLAVARVGAVAVPLNFSYRRDELAAALAHAGCVVLVTISRSLATDFLAALDDITPGWETRVRSDRVPALRQVVLVDPDRDGALDLRGLADRGAAIGQSTVQARTEAADPDAVCDIVFTSGTSGLPLAAELTHEMVLRSGYGSAFHRAFDDGWRVCFSLPMYHVFGYIEGLIAAMMVGGAVIPRRVFNPATLLAAAAWHRAREVLFVPTMSVAVVEQAAKQHYDLSALESVFSAAAPAPVWLWERVQQMLAPRTVFTGYGQTEVSAATTLTQPGDRLETVAQTVGCPKLGGLAATDASGRLAQYRTVEPFTGQQLPPGQEGELAVYGPIVTRNYHRDPVQTARSIGADGWLRTGDLGHIRSTDGYLQLTGRASELFKVGGELVAPKEVEDLLTGVAGVAQAFVAGVLDQRMGEVGWAWVVRDDSPRSGTADGTAGDAAADDAGAGGPVDLSEQELLRYCRAHLAPFKVPRALRFIDADDLPKTTTGKVQTCLSG